MTGSPRANAPSPPELGQAWQAALHDYLTTLRVEAGLARSTLQAYASDLRAAARWFCLQGQDSPRALEARHVVDWLYALRARGFEERSLARKLCVLRTLCAHLASRGQLERDPCAQVESPVLSRGLPRVLAHADVERLLAAPAGDGWADVRDRALLELLYATGARISEAVGLTTDAIETPLGVVRLFGKGGKTRLVPLGEPARAALTEWIDGPRARLPNAHKQAQVFLSRRGAALDRVSAWRRIKRAALRAGIATRVTPHLLRHSFASHLLEGGAHIRSVQELLGHASVGTTEIYTHLDAEHVLALHRLNHPRA